MRTIIIEAETDSNDRIDIIKKDVEMELNCCSTWFDCDTLKVYEKADTPQTEVDDGEDYLRGYNDGYYARGILDKAGVEIHIDKPRGFSLMSPSDKSQADCPWK